MSETTIAIIVIKLVPEANNIRKQRIEKEIAKSLQCDWLLQVEKATILDGK